MVEMLHPVGIDRKLLSENTEDVLMTANVPVGPDLHVGVIRLAENVTRNPMVVPPLVAVRVVVVIHMMHMMVEILHPVGIDRTLLSENTEDVLMTANVPVGPDLHVGVIRLAENVTRN